MRKNDYNDTGFVPSKPLRILSLRWNPIFKKMKNDREEKLVILSFLKLFSTIFNLGFLKCDYDDIIGDYDSDIEYALRINHARRRSARVEGSTSSAAGSAAGSND
jgi:hypothetical protein